MNYKLLFPTYRTRYQFVSDILSKYTDSVDFNKVLHLGSGEGDYDYLISKHSKSLISCDVNENDVLFAKYLNADLLNINYQVENALELSFHENDFDLLVTIDVLEHVERPELMMKEIGRVLKPGGLALITFPHLHFPFTYDPINKILNAFTKTKISYGAYAFGHEFLLTEEQIRLWAAEHDMEVLATRNLSGYLAGLLEIYWPGIMQKMFKANAYNISDKQEKKIKIRPSRREPFMVKLTDVLIKLDYLLFKNSKYSVGKGCILKKKLHLM